MSSRHGGAHQARRRKNSTPRLGIAATLSRQGGGRAYYTTDDDAEPDAEVDAEDDAEPDAEDDADAEPDAEAGAARFREAGAGADDRRFTPLGAFRFFSSLPLVLIFECLVASSAMRALRFR